MDLNGFSYLKNYLWLINYILNFKVISLSIHKIKEYVTKSYSILLPRLVLTIFIVKTFHSIVAVVMERVNISTIIL